MENIVINPEANPDLANELNDLLSDYIPSVDSVRDNCIAINKELFNKLFMYGYTPEIVSGLFRVDNHYGWLDPEDFTFAELVKVREMFGSLSRESLEDYVDSLPEKEKDQYRLIPHVFLVLDDLILDASHEMYSAKVTPDRYLDEDGNPIVNR